MEATQKKDQFNRAYLHAVATVAGFTCTEPAVDDDSIDVLISANGKHDIPGRPRLEAQLKCSDRLVVKDDEVFDESDRRFQIDRKNYDDLRAENVSIPRILILLSVPKNEADWVSATPEQLVLRNCAWWTSLRGLPDKDTQSSTITVSSRNLLTPSELTRIMGLAAAREPLA